MAAIQKILRSSLSIAGDQEEEILYLQGKITANRKTRVKAEIKPTALQPAFQISHLHMESVEPFFSEGSKAGMF